MYTLKGNAIKGSTSIISVDRDLCQSQASRHSLGMILFLTASLDDPIAENVGLLVLDHDR